MLLYDFSVKGKKSLFDLVKDGSDWIVELTKYGRTRSDEINDRFHGWITWMARQTGEARVTLYVKVLLKAIEIVAEGGDPYPYAVVNGVAYPYRTRDRTNKQMMTACFACEMVAAEELDIPELPEGRK